MKLGRHPAFAGQLPDSTNAAYPLIRYRSVDQSPPPPPASPKFQGREFGGGETISPRRGAMFFLVITNRQVVRKMIISNQNGLKTILS
jgi:hypothetical protein